MAYAHSIRQLVKKLHESGHSAEDILVILSKMIENYPSGFELLSQMARTFQIMVTEADWQELLKGIPSSKTVRRWLSIPDPTKVESMANITICETKETNQTKETQNDSVKEFCPASPEAVDVFTLKGYGIKSGQAAGIIAAWRESHRSGTHKQCDLYKQFVEDLKYGIPPVKAQALFDMEERSREFNIESAHRDAELVRKYRPWEGKENWEACTKEIRTLDKPIFDLRERHLDEIEKLYVKWLENIQQAQTKKDYRLVFEIEDDPLFWRLSDHSFEVGEKFGKIRVIRTLLPNEEPKLTLKEESKRRKTMQDLTRAINTALKNKLYRKEYCLGCFKRPD